MHDENLIEGLRLGDEQAYKSLYKLHYKVLCAFAYTYVKDYFVAETLVSDIIFNIWEKRDSLIINQSLRAYLMKAVKNSSINYLDHLERQNNLRQSVSQQMEKREESFHEQDYYPMSSLLEKELEGKIISTRAIVNRYQGKDETFKTLYNVFKEYNDNLETPMKQIPNIQLKLTPDLFFLKYKKISHNQFISFRFVLGL